MQYNTVVIGAGSAGAILAARLSEDRDCSVLLIEAGPDYPTFDETPPEVKYAYGFDRNRWARILGEGSKHNWHYTARATDQTPDMPVPRGRIVGGSSAVNAQIFLRGIPEDYDSWAAAGNAGWSYRDLLPFFRRVETDRDIRDDFHGADGPVPVRRWQHTELNPDQRAFFNACREQGWPESPDENNPDSTGIGPTPMNNADSVRWSTALTYLAQARHRLNLTIRADCLVHHINFNGNRATGVSVESGGKVFDVQASEVIICGGAIGSPHLLLRSGVGSLEQLARLGIPVVADLPGVGKNLRDHPQVAMTWRTKPSFVQDPLWPRIQVALRYTATGSKLRNDMFIHPVSFDMGSNIYIVSDGDPLGIGMIAAIYLAAGAGELTLRSADPHVQPVLDYNFLTEASDRDRLREAVRMCMKLAESKAFRDIINDRLDPTDADLNSDAALDRWLLRKVRTSHHVSGTCKMGPASDPMAVVDAQGRVHGVKGLRVADASIMPDCIRANTNVTALVIGERVADFIRSGK